MEIKERIVEKAKEYFLKFGIKSVRMDEIASALGVSKKTIYQFFQDKEDLADAVLNKKLVVLENKKVTMLFTSYFKKWKC
jgi:AcrR family transcriptional regulator